MPADTTPANSKPGSRRWIWLRRGVQAFSLALFLVLLILTMQGATGRLPYDLFFFLDPLNGITSMIGGRTWIMPMALGLITLVSALIIGRGWCGWVCPLGTVFDWTPSGKGKDGNRVSIRWKQVKYAVLLAVIIGAVTGSLTLNFLDPVTLLFRTVAAVIMPGLGTAIEGIESWLYGVGTLRPALDWIDGILRGWLLNAQPFYLLNLVLLGVFLAILGLNFIRPKFWCRYICPLGGLLGLVSKASVFTHSVDGDNCISCRKCSRLCSTRAIDPENGFRADFTECTICLHCREQCPMGAISFERKRTPTGETDPSRRAFVYTIGAGIIAAGFSRLAGVIGDNFRDRVRPPGSTEESLYGQCIRCGECVRICPTGAIQPSGAPGGGMIWTPVMETRLGYCDYGCNSCGIICPTGAIESLSLEEKRKKVIGIAFIDRERCIPWADNTDCIVCEEMCPIPEKAIILKGSEGRRRVRRPEVIVDLCIGCGICEHQCPVEGEAAIKMYTPETVPVQEHEDAGEIV